MPRNLIIDEFLTFVQNKYNKLDELSIVQICSTSFSDGEIEEGKAKLFNALPEDCRGGRLVTRKGEDKSKKNIKDVLKLLKEADHKDHPIFVAQDLDKLPPVTFEHVDVSRLLRDLACMKSELENLRHDAVSKTELTTFETKITSEIASLSSTIRATDNRQNNTPKNHLAENKYTNLNKKNHVSKLADLCTDKNTPLSGENSSKSKRPIQLFSSQPQAGASSSANTISEPAFHTPTYRDITLRPSLASLETAAVTHRKVEPRTNVNRHDDSFIRVEYKKNKRPKYNKNMIGMSQKASVLEVAESTTAVYISRLKKHIQADKIKEHIQSRDVECHSVQLLEQRYRTNFNSFKAVIPTEKLKTFLSVDFWPKGIKYRRFRGRETNDVTNISS